MFSFIRKLMLIVISIAAYTASAQTIVVVKDATTLLPIANVSFAYGEQSGFSGTNGGISLMYKAGTSISLSHVGYESITILVQPYDKDNAQQVVLLMPAIQQSLGPVIVYGLRGKQSRQSIKLATGDWVQHDAGQVLMQMTGFSAVRKSAAYAADPVFRGFSREQLTVVNDGGLTAHAACPNRMDPPTSQVMISQVQAVEVLKGPHSFRYGPGFGAVINFKTSSPVFFDKPTVFGRVSAGAESNGSVLRTEGMLGMANNKWRIAAVGSYSEGDNYTDGSDSSIPAFFNRAAVGLQVAHQLTKANLLQAQVSRNFTRNTAFPTLAMDLLSDDTWMTQIQWTNSPANTWYQKWHTQVYASMVDHAMGNKLRPTSATMLAYVKANTATYGGRTELTIEKRKAQMHVGLDYKFDEATGNRSRTMRTGPMAGKVFIDTIWQESKLQRAGIFADYQQLMGTVSLVVSGRVDVVQGNSSEPSAKFSTLYTHTRNTDVNASISIGATKKMSQHFMAGAWLGRGVRSAGIMERYIHFLPVGSDPYEVVGNPMLKPEANHQLDVQLAYQSATGRVELNLYGAKVQDYITAVVRQDLKPVLNTSPGVRQYVNIDAATLWGFEILWQQQLSQSFDHQLNWQYNYAWNEQLNQPLPEIPPMEFRYRLAANLWKGKLNPYASIRYATAQKKVSLAFAEKITDAFTTVDMGIQTTPWKNVHVSLAVNNLLDATYREHLSRFIAANKPMNAVGRSVVLMASFEW